MNWTERSAENFLSRITFDFITQLEKKMESLPLTQLELAEKLKVSEGRVSQILNNPSNLTLKSIIKYARALGMKVAVVAYEDNDPDNERGLVNSEIFSICWEKQGAPADFFSLEETFQQYETENSNVRTSDKFASEPIKNPSDSAITLAKLTEVKSNATLTDCGISSRSNRLSKQPMQRGRVALVGAV